MGEAIVEQSSQHERVSGPPSLGRVLAADLYRARGSRGAIALFQAALLDRCFRAVFTMRLCQAATRALLARRLLLLAARSLHALATHIAGMDLSWQAQVGPGFVIVHGWGLVLSPGARLGANVTLFHGATIGRADRPGAEGSIISKFPVIEDDVWMGPHAVVVGAVRVGAGARLLANCFIAQDVPSRALMGGNPATVLKHDCAPDVVRRGEL